MNILSKIAAAVKPWIVPEEEPKTSSRTHTKGRIHLVTPDGRVELKAEFDNRADFDRIRWFVENEDGILFGFGEED